MYYYIDVFELPLETYTHWCENWLSNAQNASI